MLFVVNSDVNHAGVLLFSCAGTSVIQVTATDADDPTYGNSARLVYSILQGQPYFSVEPHTGTHQIHLNTFGLTVIKTNKKTIQER